jgi:hypothetical protein
MSVRGFIYFCRSIFNLQAMKTISLLFITILLSLSISCKNGKTSKENTRVITGEADRPVISDSKEKKDTILPGTVPVNILSLKFGTDDSQLGQGMSAKQIDGGKSIDAVPSFTVNNKQLYIIDAINFRILVYDLAGSLVRKISYPQNNSDNSPVVIKDIAADNDFVYLLSVYENIVYVVDSKTEDVVTRITSTETKNKKFSSISSLYLNNDKSLIITDQGDNTLYIYMRDNLKFKLIKSAPYKSVSHFVFDRDGNGITVEAAGKNYSIFRSDGGLLAKHEFSLNSGGVEFIGIDRNFNIYLRTVEYDIAGAQNADDSYIKVIARDGTLKASFPVDTWPGAGMSRYIVVSEDGLIFVASFDFAFSGGPDDPPVGFVIRQIN